MLLCSTFKVKNKIKQQPLSLRESRKLIKSTLFGVFLGLLVGRKWQPTPVFLPGESQGRGSLVGCLYGVTQRRTRLK